MKLQWMKDLLGDAYTEDLDAKVCQAVGERFVARADFNEKNGKVKELEAQPKDTDTMEVRKARIKGTRNMETPYTLPWLKSLCGPDGHKESVVGYAINIQLDYNKLQDPSRVAAEILNMLLMVRPENMRVLMTAFLQSTGALSCGACAEMSNYTEIWPHSCWRCGRAGVHRDILADRIG